MLLRRKNLRSRTPKKFKVFSNEIKPHGKKTPKKLHPHHVEIPKATKNIDFSQKSLENVLSRVKKQVHIIKYQLPKISLNAGKYKLRSSSCGIDDLLFLTSTPNKPERENKKSKTFDSKNCSHVKTSNTSVSNQKKRDEIFIQKVSQVQEKKKGLSISPIPLIQKVPNLRKRKKSASVSSKCLVNRQTAPLSKKRRSLIPFQTNSQKKSPVKTRSRSSLSSKSSFIEDSLQKEKSSSFIKSCSEKSSKIKETNKKPLLPLNRMGKSNASLLSKYSLTEDTIPNKPTLTSSKSCPKKSCRENKNKNCSHTSKMKGHIKKTEDPKKINDKTELTKLPFVVLKRVSPRLKLKRDDLNISSNNTTEKNARSNKLKSSSFNGHQFKKSSKSHRIKDQIFKKPCDKNLDISTPKTLSRSSTVCDTTSSPKSVRNSLIEKGKNVTKIIREKNTRVTPNNSILSPSKTPRKVQQKRRHTVPAMKKKNNGLINTKNSKSTDKAVKRSAKLTSKLKSIATPNKYFFDINGIPVDDLLSTSFATPSNIIKSKNKKLKVSQVTSSPINKKNPLKCKNKLDGLSCQVPNKGLPGKGTLKRKRFIIEALKEKSEGYEDDIFESSKFDMFKETLFMDDDSDTSGFSICTPKCAFLVTPRMPEKTPRFKDCFSPMELLKARKVAEEYIYRRNKRKLHASSASESSLQEGSTNQQNEKRVDEDPEKKKLDFVSLAKSLNEKQNKSEDSDEDVYFSDASS